MALCTRKYPKTKYYKAIDSEQPYNSTTYIEKIPKEKMDKVATRAYFYDKTAKEELDYNVTRFEIKFQDAFYGNNIDAINGVLDRYHILFINNNKKKKEMMKLYDSYKTIRKQDIHTMKLEQYRIYPETISIVWFFNKLYSVREKKMGFSFL